MVKTGQKWSKVVQNIQELSKAVQNGPKWSKYGTNWYQMGPNGPTWSNMVKNAFKWSHMVQKDQKWSHIVQNGPNCLKKFKLVPNFQKCSKLSKIGLVKRVKRICSPFKEHSQGQFPAVELSFYFVLFPWIATKYSTAKLKRRTFFHLQ